MSQVLIVDDEASICWALRRLLGDAGHQAQVAASAEEGLRLAQRERPDLVLLDIRLPGLDGLAAMKQFVQLAPGVPVVIMTAFGSLSTAVEALAGGAFDYLIKPFDLDQAAAVISRALAGHGSAVATEQTAPELAAEAEELWGASAAMQEVFKRIALVAPSEASVLITGESGTGKELVARAIHRHSARSGMPLLPVNLAALSPTLIESELFGHARGAFTGALDARQGLLELADGGTVFFDEAGDIPPVVQVKLLRVLERQEVTPVGETRSRPSSFRVIAATHHDLRDLVQRGGFREDLYFRLAVFQIALPPLRERIDDIPLLAQRFLRRATATPAAGFSTAAVDELCRRPWRGNVRELRNAVEHAVIVARGGLIEPTHLPAVDAPVAAGDAGAIASLVRQWAESQFRDAADASDLYDRLLEVVEPPLLEVALRTHRGQRLSAARSLGLHRATLRKKLAQFGVHDE